MRNNIIVLILLLLLANRTAIAKDCPDKGYGFIEGKELNLAVVPIDKYPNYVIQIKDKTCPPPQWAVIPKAVDIIGEKLKNNKKVVLYVAGSNDSAGGLLEAKWESLFLHLFGDNSNFSIIEHPKIQKEFKEITKNQPSKTEIEANGKEWKLQGVTHMLIVNGARSKNDLLVFKTDYYTGRLIDIDTGKLLSVDEIVD